MCGIAGKIDFGGPVDETVIHRMCEAMVHRGPDSQGVFVGEGVGLGVRRLAIIDVAGGDQPIFNEDRTVAVVQNGEIYNFQELREQLVRRGHRFSSHTDTEVLVHLYEDRGEAMVAQLRGMFAFAIWDARRRRLFCARDRIGKKPLFWYRDGSRFWFGSELQALLQDPDIDRSVDEAALAIYLAAHYVPHPLTAFRGVRKLPPASTLTVTEDGERIERYWSVDYSAKTTDVPLEELKERVWAELREATRIRLMSEVPLGAFLSGGVDSSAVVAAMAEQTAEPVKTFSIGFSDDDYDELRYARMVAQRFGTDHHEFRVEPSAIEIMPKLIRHYGEPFADPSAIPTFYLARLTAEHVTVALNGDGGDESFGGYDRYPIGDKAPHLNWLPKPIRVISPALTRIIGDGKDPSSLRTKLTRLAHILAMSPAERYATAVSAFDMVRWQRLVTPEFAAVVDGRDPYGFIVRAWDESGADNRVDRMMATDVETYLPDDLLVKMDIATMAYSVEARSPFLDHHVMELAASLPAHYKLSGTNGKRLLKEALRGVLPEEILTRPKMGFGVPLGRWFREELRDYPADVLLDPRSLGRGYFRAAEVEALIREHRDHVADHSKRLWVLLQLELWHREMLESPAPRSWTRSRETPSPSGSSP